MRALLTAIAYGGVIACNTAIHKQDNSVFHQPVIVQPQITDSIKKFERNYIDATFPLFAGKYSFSDSLKLSLARTRQAETRDDLRRRWKDDSINTVGLDLFIDHQSTVYRDEYGSGYVQPYYPVYLVNQTSSMKDLVGKDGYVFGIQEALDSNGTWRPIEGRGFDFCGNGYWALKVRPKEYVAILFQKYEGSYKTKLRIRMVNGDNTYVSTSFNGSIDPRQFRLEKDKYLYRSLKENTASAVRYLFYGAEPQEMDAKGFAVHAVVAF